MFQVFCSIFKFLPLQLYQVLYHIVWKLQYKNMIVSIGLHGIGMEITWGGQAFGSNGSKTNWFICSWQNIAYYKGMALVCASHTFKATIHGQSDGNAKGEHGDWSYQRIPISKC
jgi:hypothetical protein